MSTVPSTAPRIALLGCGNWAKAMHVPALKHLEQEGKVNVSLLCDLNIEQAQNLASEFNNAKATDSIDALYTNNCIDALAVLLPPGVNVPYIERAVENKLPFLCEKPPAASIAEHEKLRDLIADLPHVVAYNRRFAPYARQARQHMAGETLRSITAEFCRFGRKDEDFSSTYVHGLDACCGFIGKVTQANVHIKTRDEKRVYNLQLINEDGAVCTLIIDQMGGAGTEHIILRSKTKSARIHYWQFGMSDLPGSVDCYDGNKLVSKHSAADYGFQENESHLLGGIVAEYEALIDCIKTKKPAASNFTNTIDTQILREKIENAAALGDGFYSLLN